MSEMNTIDINCDMGESYGNFKIGNDDLIFPLITSSNVACGFHAGDPLHIEATLLKAKKHNVAVGAHPGYPDLAGFGRRRMQIPLKELKSIVKYQVAAVKGLAESHDIKLAYVKPHGALYNSAVDNREEALTIMDAMNEIDSSLILLGLAGSLMQQVANEQDFQFAAEAFADRRYTADGKLMSRALEDAVIKNSDEAAQQVIDIVTKGQVSSTFGQVIKIKANSICIHGDNPAAVNILKSIKAALNQAGIRQQSFT